MKYPLATVAFAVFMTGAAVAPAAPALGDRPPQ